MYKSRIEYITCDICDNLVLINGCGPVRQQWLTRILDFIFPYAQKHFWEAAKKHDMAYHKGIQDSSHSAKWWKTRADRIFLRDCLVEASNKTRHNFIQRKVLRIQANAYYLSLTIGGDNNFGNDGCKESH